MSIRKRICAKIFGAIALTICLSFALSACDDDSKQQQEPTVSASEKTYDGILSIETYDSAEDAAKYYIEHDVLNDKGLGTFIDYAKSADLTQEEIASLPISNEEKAELLSAEKGVAYYSKYSNAPTTTLNHLSPSLTPGLSGPYEVIYILKFSGPYYKYFVPTT